MQNKEITANRAARIARQYKATADFTKEVGERKPRGPFVTLELNLYDQVGGRLLLLRASKPSSMANLYRKRLHRIRH